MTKYKLKDIVSAEYYKGFKEGLRVCKMIVKKSGYKLVLPNIDTLDFER